MEKRQIHMSKRTRKPVQVAELPPPERGQHGDVIDMIETPVAGVLVARVRPSDAFHRYWKLGVLGHGQDAESRWQSGMGWRQDFHATGREPSVTALYGEWIAGTGQTEAWSEIRQAAERRYSKAATKLVEAGNLLDLLMSVAIMGNPICGHWRRRGKQMTRLREGLDVLRKVY